jgi:hypothetical protein
MRRYEAHEVGAGLVGEDPPWYCSLIGWQRQEKPALAVLFVDVTDRREQIPALARHYW